MDECLTKPFNAADPWAALDRVLKAHPPGNMCLSLQSRVSEHLTAIRESLHDQNALCLREAAHKCYGILSAFSTIAGNQAADLEDIGACGMLNEALPVMEQLAKCATELAHLAGGLTIETLRKQAESANDPNRAADI